MKKKYRELMKKIFKTQIGFLMILSTAIFFSSCSKRSAAPPPTVPVEAAAAQKKTVPLIVSCFGTVEAYSSSAVRSQITGVLTAVHFIEGQAVKKSDPLLTIDPRPCEAALKLAQANLAKDEAQLKNAEKEIVRQQELLKKGFTSQGEFDQSEATVGALRATVKADNAAVENAKLQLDYCSIGSPIDGVAGMLLIQQGNLIKANDVPIVTINQIKPIYVTFTVGEEYLPQIQKFMAENKLAVTAIPSKTNEDPSTGHLSFVDNCVNVGTGMIRLRATFENEQGRLWPGQYVDVSLVLTEEPNMIVVPSQAVQTGQNGQFVYIVKADQTIEERKVTQQRSIKNDSVITGVQENEIVITDGQLRLMPGCKVQIKNAIEKRAALK
jgi:membrane fusion protein, multidrug efflux system